MAYSPVIYCDPGGRYRRIHHEDFCLPTCHPGTNHGTLYHLQIILHLPAGLLFLPKKPADHHTRYTGAVYQPP